MNLYSELKLLCCEYLNCFHDVYLSYVNRLGVKGVCSSSLYKQLCVVVALQDKMLRATFENYANERYDKGVSAGEFSAADGMQQMQVARDMFIGYQQSVFEHMALLSLQHVLGNELMLKVKALAKVGLVFPL